MKTIKEYGIFFIEFLKNLFKSGYTWVALFILLVTMVFLSFGKYCDSHPEVGWCDAFKAPVELSQDDSTVSLKNVPPTFDYPTEPIRLNTEAVADILQWLYQEETPGALKLCGDWNHDLQLYELYVCKEGG